MSAVVVSQAMKELDPNPTRSSTSTLPFVAALAAAALPFDFRDEARAQEPVPAVRPAQKVEKSEPVVVANVFEVVKSWRADRNLYVCGNVGLGQEQLKELAGFLKQHPNWTVYLAERCKGERYVDADGKVYLHDKAVSHCLGKELPNQTGFGTLTDARTGQKNGNVLYITFDAERTYRKLAFLGGEAYDSRGLGESKWTGNLDRTAVEALQNGRRVADAVTGTVNLIDGKLNELVQADINRELERKRVADNALASASEKYALLGASLAAFKTAYPALTGDLTAPDLPGMQRELASAKTVLEQKEYEKSAKISAGVADRAGEHDKLLQDYGPDAKRFEAANLKLEELGKRGHQSAAKTELEEAKAELERGGAQYGQGNRIYAAHLRTAEETIQNAEAKIEAADRSAANWQLTGILFGAAVILGSGATVAVMNRMRAGKKDEALKKLGEWNEGLKEDLEKLFTLDSRMRAAVGNKSEEIKLQGESRELAEKVIEQVGHLFLMQASAAEVVRRAEALTKPGGTLDAFKNFILAANYNRALDELQKPIEFDPSSGMELVIKGPRNDLNLFGRKAEDYKAFSIPSLGALIEEFNKRGATTTAGIKHLEDCIREANDRVGSGERAVTSTKGKAEGNAAAASDGLFGCPAVLTEVVPDVTSRMGESKLLAVHDPVASVRISNDVTRITGDVDALIGVIGKAREEVLPPLRTAEEALRVQGYATDWVSDALSALSEKADATAKSSSNLPVREEVLAIEGELSALGARVQKAALLEERLRESTEKAIETSTKLVDTERTNLATPLMIDPGLVMREKGDDPSAHLDAATKLVAEARESLKQGEVDAAERSLGDADKLVREANAVVAATKKAFEEYNALSSSLTADTERLERLVPSHSAVLESIEKGYAPAVMTLGEGDTLHPRGNGTVRDNIDEANQSLNEAKRVARDASELFEEGRFLQSSALLRQIDAIHAFVNDRFKEIVEKRDRLVAVTEANREKLDELEQSRKELAKSVNEKRTQKPTMQAFSSATEDLEARKRDHAAKQPNPFMIQKQLAVVSDAFDKVSHSVRADRALYEEASRSYTAAKEQLEGSLRILDTAANDDVRDSTAIVAARRKVEDLEQELERSRKSLNANHGDWGALDREVDRIAAEAATHTATVRGELQKAQDALEAINSAVLAYRDVTNWDGRWGVSIDGNAGSDTMQRARALRAQGDYVRAAALAGVALEEINRALSEARSLASEREAAEQRRIAEEERRIATERQARIDQEEALRKQAGKSDWTDNSSRLSDRVDTDTNDGSGFKASDW